MLFAIQRFEIQSEINIQRSNIDVRKTVLSPFDVYIVVFLLLLLLPPLTADRRRYYNNIYAGTVGTISNVNLQTLILKIPCIYIHIMHIKTLA